MMAETSGSLYAGTVANPRASVLVVEDEPTIADLVARYLDRARFETRVAVDGKSALREIARRAPDLVVLDLMLPAVDGLEVMRRTRREGNDRTAFIVLTAKGEESDRITGLRLGADDYVVKPFSPSELVARVEAVLRRRDRAPGADDELLRFDELEIDPRRHAVAIAGKQVTLTAREFELLLFLARHPAQVFSREQLMDAVWQHAFWTDTATVTVHIKRLRDKLEIDASAPRFLETVWGVGYRFVP